MNLIIQKKAILMTKLSKYLIQHLMASTTLNFSSSQSTVSSIPLLWYFVVFLPGLDLFCHSPFYLPLHRTLCGTLSSKSSSCNNCSKKPPLSVIDNYSSHLSLLLNPTTLTVWTLIWIPNQMVFWFENIICFITPVRPQGRSNQGRIKCYPQKRR